MAKKLNYYTAERLGKNRSLTPEGFLVCHDTPIARTGPQVYGPGEIWTKGEDGVMTAMDVGPDGILYVDREAADVFHPDTVASFNGKPVVNGHPEADVTPENWRELAVGIVLNPHRGIGADDDLILADLVIHNKTEIDAVNNGLREVSCGYDADYLPTGVGRAKQFNIYGNHVALVEAGRCGPRCAIRDSNYEETKMTVLERLKAAFKSKDEAAFDAVLKEVPPEGAATHVHVHTRDGHEEGCACAACKKTKDSAGTMDAAVDARFKKVEDAQTAMAADIKSIKDAVAPDDEDEDDDEDDEDKKKKKAEDEENAKIEGTLEMEAPPGTGDAARKAKDSSFLADSWQEAVSLAEVIAPGMAMPGTFDAKLAPRKTLDAICKFRRSVLDVALAQPDTRSFLDGVMGGHDLKTYTCDGVRQLFRSVGAFKKRINNDTRNADAILPGHGGGTGVKHGITAAELNKRNAEFYKSV